MIKSRNSNDHLHSETILEKISEYDIFRYYCPNFKELGVKFCSDIREDDSPSVSIVEWKGRLLYKDFGHPDHSYNCFRYIQEKYNCKFIDALRIIDNDFGLNLSLYKDEVSFTMGVLGFRSGRQLERRKTTIIKKKSRSWNKKDAEFWKQYLISKKTLCKFDVSPISHYWINENRFSCEQSYAFRVGNKFKIYSPYETDTKWTSNTTKNHIQGYKQLPEEGNLCILASSLKDVMCLFEMGFSAIALQSEMQMPEEALIKKLQERFKKVVVLYDNDFDNPGNPGQTMAQKICQTYSLKNIYIPEEYCVKDISDYVAKFTSLGGPKKLIELQL